MLTAVTIVLLFINPIAGLFAAPGLFGAAAFNAGMAALGGGAIAAGGFGITFRWKYRCWYRNIDSCSFCNSIIRVSQNGSCTKRDYFRSTT